MAYIEANWIGQKEYGNSACGEECMAVWRVKLSSVKGLGRVTGEMKVWWGRLEKRKKVILVVLFMLFMFLVGRAVGYLEREIGVMSGSILSQTENW